MSFPSSVTTATRRRPVRKSLSGVGASWIRDTGPRRSAVWSRTFSSTWRKWCATGSSCTPGWWHGAARPSCCRVGSYAGKTSMVAALLTAGAEYLSDEYAVFDPSGGSIPMPGGFRCERMTGARFRRPGPEEFGSRHCPGPLSIGLVAMTRICRRRTLASHASAHRLGMLALLNNMVPIRRQPERCLHVVERVLAEAVCVRGKRGEAEDTAPALLEAVACHPAPSRPCPHNRPEQPLTDSNQGEKRMFPKLRTMILSSRSWPMKCWSTTCNATKPTA